MMARIPTYKTMTTISAVNASYPLMMVSPALLFRKDQKKDDNR
jgi:hypothetical protein